MKTSLLKSVVISAIILSSATLTMASEIGSSCDNPIKLNKDLQVTISEPGSYWFSSWTYDLPLTVYYIPEVFDNDQRPVAYVDFSCTTGKYDDPNLVELTNLATGWGIEMPILFKPVETLVNGQRAYKLSVQESHRDMMREFGILYDVEAKVEVIVPASGKIELVPDTAFRTCVESSTWVTIPDTIHVTPVDWNKSYVLPLSDWKNDSVRLTWTGQKQSMTLWLGTDCSFELDEEDANFARRYELNPTEGQNVLDLVAADINDLYQYGSLLYAKFVSAESASLIVDYKPMSPEMARAIRMYPNEPVAIKSKDIDQYYYFKSKLTENSLQFTSDKKDTVVAYFGTSPVFELQSADHIATFTLCPISTGSQLSLSKKQLDGFAKNIDSEYLFVRFEAPRAANLTLSSWNASECVEKSVEILPNGSFALPTTSTSNVYRMDYYQWNKGDVELYWDGQIPLPMYIADTCVFDLKNDPHMVLNASIAKKSTYTITKDVLETMANRVDSDGYLYFRFNPRIKGNLTTKLIPIVVPEPTSPCIEASLLVQSGDQMVLNLDSAFTVYRIKYEDFAQTGASFTWTGAEPLHTFVAETCDFAVAPYNKYVHVYVPVQGEHTLDAAAMAELAEYVDADGYLYIRFLTEKEGMLTIE